MIDDSGVWMIDPEFAMYGPMGFDVGKVREEKRKKEDGASV